MDVIPYPWPIFSKSLLASVFSKIIIQYFFSFTACQILLINRNGQRDRRHQTTSQRMVCLHIRRSPVHKYHDPNISQWRCHDQTMCQHDRTTRQLQFHCRTVPQRRFHDRATYQAFHTLDIQRVTQTHHRNYLKFIKTANQTLVLQRTGHLKYRCPLTVFPYRTKLTVLSYVIL